MSRTVNSTSTTKHWNRGTLVISLWRGGHNKTNDALARARERSGGLVGSTETECQPAARNDARPNDGEWGKKKGLPRALSRGFMCVSFLFFSLFSLSLSLGEEEEEEEDRDVCIARAEIRG